MSDETNDAVAAMRRAAELWPQNGNTRLSEYLGVSSSRVREWLRGARPIPGGVQQEVNDLLAQFPNGFHQVDPHATIRILHEALQAGGYTSGEAAAAIFGVAHALAVRVNGRDETLQALNEIR